MEEIEKIKLAKEIIDKICMNRKSFHSLAEFAFAQLTASQLLNIKRDVSMLETEGE